jgi:hypothetical protein
MGNFFSFRKNISSSPESITIHDEPPKIVLSNTLSIVKEKLEDEWNFPNLVIGKKCWNYTHYVWTDTDILLLSHSEIQKLLSQKSLKIPSHFQTFSTELIHIC